MLRKLIIICALYCTNIFAHIYFVSSYHQSIEKLRELFPYLAENFSYEGKRSVEYLDSKRLSPAEYGKNADEIFKKIKRDKPRLIFLCDDNALKLLGERLVEIGMKVVSLGINENPRKYLSPKNFSEAYGVLERPLFLRAIVELNGIIKKKKKITIIFDDSTTSKTIINDVFGRNKSVRSSDNLIEYFVAKNKQEILDIIERANKEDTHLFIGPIHTIRKSKKKLDYFDFHDLLKVISRNYQREYYSFWKDYVFENGALAVYGVDMILQSKEAIRLGQDLLKGRDIRVRFISPKRGQVFYSKEQIVRRGLPVKETIEKLDRLK